MNKELSTLCNNVSHSVKAVYKLPYGTPRQSAVIAVAQELRDARRELAIAKRTRRGKALVEIEREEKKLEKMNYNLAKDILGIDLKVLSKVKA